MIYLPCVFSHTLFNATFFQKEKMHLSPTFRFKALEYIFVPHHLDQGVRLWHIQKGLGDSSSKTTAIYTGVFTQEVGKIKNPLDDFY
ncbi:hypothetical protein OAC51_09935 [Flavobacteriaceae bacterium]|nr:hypothetical protein [Flavobacteriaceae bacterium]